MIFVIIILLITFSLISFNSFSAERDLAKEQKLGKKLSRDIEKKYELVNDSHQNRLINEIGQKLAKYSGLEELKFYFKILKKDGPNAFSIPGGYVYITFDLLDYIQSDDELAGILAHEIAHVIHNHALKQTRDNTKYTLLTILGALLTGEPDVAILGKLTTITLLNQYSREYEEEADLTAIDLLIKADFNPVGFLTYMERQYSREMFRPSIDLGIFQTHPDTVNRVNYIKEKLKEQGVEINRRVTTNYLEVSTKYIIENSLTIGIIYIGNIEILRLSFVESRDTYSRITDSSQKLDISLSIDLFPYEVSIRSEKESSLLFIRNNKVISLKDSETAYLNKTAEEVLHDAKSKIKQVLWEFRLNMPFDIKGNLED
ncbi:MAG: M48 family metalloprotease [Candidatus Caldatribacteriota bacterium]|nr:M48 family metalloprotease [Candidatus Caldatribacteriota bacterium]